MSNFFNTTFEISMRVLMVLLVDGKPKSVDMIAAIDFMAVYGQTFNIAESNLHGNNFYKYGEFAARRGMVKKAIKQLLQNDMVDVYEKEDGFCFMANDSGADFGSSLDSDYAHEYSEAVRAASIYIGTKSDNQIIKMIISKSSTGLRIGD